MKTYETRIFHKVNKPTYYIDILKERTYLIPHILFSLPWD
jgi:hypothetical protein